MAVPRAAQPALYRRMTDTLRGRLDDGTYPPGGRLPSEPILAAELGVHRLTVRRAVEELARRAGTPRQGSGLVAPAGDAGRHGSLHGDGVQPACAARDSRPAIYDRLVTTDRDECGWRTALAGASATCRQQARGGQQWVCSPAWGPGRRRRDVASVWRQTDGIYGVLLDTPAAPLRYLWRSFGAEPASIEDAHRLGVPSGTAVVVREGLTADADGKPVLWVRRRARFDRVRYVLRYDT